MQGAYTSQLRWQSSQHGWNQNLQHKWCWHCDSLLQEWRLKSSEKELLPRTEHPWSQSSKFLEFYPSIYLEQYILVWHLVLPAKEECVLLVFVLMLKINRIKIIICCTICSLTGAMDDDRPLFFSHFLLFSTECWHSGLFLNYAVSLSGKVDVKCFTILNSPYVKPINIK